MPTVSEGLGGGGLSPSKKCGEMFCPVYYVCLEHDFRCYPCQPYCNKTSINFDERICVQQCQDNIHDFVSHYVHYDEIKNTLAKLEGIQTGVISIAVMVFIAIIILFVILAFIWSLEKRIRPINNGGQDLICKIKLDSSQCVENTDPVKRVSETAVCNQTPAANGVTSLAAERTDLHNIMASTSVSSASPSGQPRTDTTPSPGGNSTNNSSFSCTCCSGCGTISELSSGYNYVLEDSPVMSSETTSSSGSSITRLSPPVDRRSSV